MSESYIDSSEEQFCGNFHKSKNIKSVFTFQKISTFDLEVDPGKLIDPIKPPALQHPVVNSVVNRLKLGFSITDLLPQFNYHRRVRHLKTPDGIDITVGASKTFLPLRKNPLPTKNGISTLKLQNIAPLRDGSRRIVIDGTAVEVSPQVRERIETRGAAYAPLVDHPNQYALVELDVDEFIVPDLQAALKDRKILIYNQPVPIRFNKKQADYIRANKAGLVYVGEHAVQLREIDTQGMRKYALSAPTPSSRDPRAAAREAAKEAAKAAKEAAIRARNQKIRRKGELPSFEIGLFQLYQQEWELLGYSRGALINSITLAPEEELSIEIHTWDKVKLEEERTKTTEYENNYETSSQVRNTTNITLDYATTLNTEVGAEGKLGLPPEKLPLEGKMNGKVAKEVKDNLKTTIDMISEATKKSSERFKATHQVKITETRETGTETKSVRKLKNPNQSHALTLHHYEVLENYRVTTTLYGDHQCCVLVENPDLGHFDLDFILAHEHKIQRVLLSPNYKPGFEAARVLAGQRWYQQSLLKAEQESKESPPSGANGSTNSAVPKKGIFATAEILAKILDRFLDVDIPKTFETLGQYYDPNDNIDVGQADYQDAMNNFGLFSFWTKLNISVPGFEARARSYVDAVPDLLEHEGSADQIIQEVRLLIDGMDEEWLLGLKMIAISVVVAFVIAGVTTIALVLIPLLPALLAIDNNNGLPAAITKARQELKSYEAKQQAEVLQPTPQAADAAAGAAPVDTQVYLLTELASAEADFQKLVLHLEKNCTYYHNQLYSMEDPNERYERLQLLGLLPIIENRLIGFVGRKAIYPLRMQALDENIVAFIEKHLVTFKTINEDGTLIIPPVVDEISLPTTGMVVEPVLSQCEGLEPYLLQHRQLDLEQKRYEVDLIREKLEQARLETERLRSGLISPTPMRNEANYRLSAGSETDGYQDDGNGNI